MKLIVKPQKNGLDFYCDSLNLQNYFKTYFQSIIISKKKIRVNGIYCQNDTTEFFEYIKKEIQCSIL